MSNIAGTVAVFVFTAAFSFVSLAARPPAVSEVKPFGGVPALWIDGRPDTGLMHWNRWPKPEDIAVFRRAGVHLYSVMGLPEMPSPAGASAGYDDGYASVPVLTEEWIDRTFSMIEREDPEAKVLLRMRLTTPKWWREANPLECVATVDSLGRRKVYPWASPVSVKWLRLCDEALRRTVRYVEERWGHLVIGYHPGIGDCAENAYAWSSEAADFSSAQTNACGVVAPDASIRFAKGFGDFRRLVDPAEAKSLVAYMHRQSECMADAVVFISECVKDELRRLGRRKVCGVFYAYLSMPVNRADIFSSGHHSHEKVLSSPAIDFIAAPIDYASRQIGGTSIAQVLPGSIAAHGKLYWAEEDTRFHLAADDVECVSESPAETREILRRNFLDAYSHGGAIWWMDLFGKGWYRDPSFAGVIGECREFALRHASNRSSVASFAVFVTERSIAAERAAPLPLSNELVGVMLPEIASCGAPYDIFRLEDLPLLERTGALGRIKAAIVLNAHSADAALRGDIRKFLCRDGRTVVFLGPAGYICGEKAGAELSCEMTGIRVKERNVRDSGVVESFTGGRRFSFGSALSSRPSFLIDDKDALIDGWYVQGSRRSRPGETRAGAIASKKNGDWTSVVCPVLFMPSDLLRHYIEKAGVHIYSPCGDQVFAGEDWCAVAAKMPGEREINLPWRESPLKIRLRRGEVRIFERRQE